MIKLALVTAIASGLLVAPIAGAQTPTQDSVTGRGSGGISSIGRYSFLIDAHSGPSGESPSGTATFAPVQFPAMTGPVTCLAVNGNSGTLNFVVVGDPSGPHVFTFTVTDLPTGDLFASALDARAPTDCTPLTSPDSSAVAEITVVDAVARPTTKDQCKNGGWQDFGIFRNQGDCVSFVVTGGKNQPANSP